jgi:hypothetical protein
VVLTIRFCEEFALDDEEKVVRMRVLQQETVTKEPMKNAGCHWRAYKLAIDK